MSDTASLSNNVLVLGVDAGGTRTQAAIVDSGFRLRGVGESGPGNYYVAGTDGARENVRLSIERALSAAGAEKSDTIVAGFGIGGLDTETDFKVVDAFLNELSFVDRRRVVNDVRIAHYAVTGGDAGVTVISGTGAIAFGMDGAGNDYRCNGWGWIIGDEGSGFYTARRGLQEAAKAYDGRGPGTELVERARNHFGVDDFESVLTTIHDATGHPKQIAPFAESVADAATTGDETARRIVADAVDELAHSAVTVHEQLRIAPPVAISCLGGLGATPLFQEEFKSVIRDRLPVSRLLEPVENPVVGAFALVAEELDVSIGRAKLRALDLEISKRTS